MPSYQYRCDKCGKRFKRTETISEHEGAKPQCPKCGSKKGHLRAGPCLRGDVKEKLARPPLADRGIRRAWPKDAMSPPDRHRQARSVEWNDLRQSATSASS
jgi:putative FmdB family regulatory protein